MDEGHIHVAETLVKNGADVNYRNKVRILIPVTQICIMWPMIRQSKRDKIIKIQTQGCKSTKFNFAYGRFNRSKLQTQGCKSTELHMEGCKRSNLQTQKLWMLLL